MVTVAVSKEEDHERQDSRSKTWAATTNLAWPDHVTRVEASQTVTGSKFRFLEQHSQVV
jgi:hypothetical protein